MTNLIRVECALKRFKPDWSWQRCRVTICSEQIDTYVLKIQHENHSLAVRVANEPSVPQIEAWRVQYWIQSKAAQVDAAPAVCGFDEQHGVWLSQWIEAPAFSIFNPLERKTRKQLAEALSRVHALAMTDAPPLKPFDWHQTLKVYSANTWVRARPESSIILKALQDDLKRVVTGPLVVVHGDPHKANWLHTLKPMLVDWEYAHVNDAIFDWAALSRYHDWPIEYSEELLNDVNFTGDWSLFERACRLFDGLHWLWCVAHQRFSTLPPPLERKILARWL